MRTPPSQLMMEVVSNKTVLDVIHEMSSKADCDDPFFVADLSDVVLKHKLWKLKLPRVQPYYAVKCNDDPVLLELLAALGTGFQCTNKAEIESLLSLDISSSRIVYANPCRTKNAIKHAASSGIGLMTFDSETELHKIHALFPNARLLLLVSANETKFQCKEGFQFGSQESEVPHLLTVARNLGLNVVGVSFHSENGCLDYNMYSKVASTARHIFHQAQSMGFEMNILDLGSGFFGHSNSKMDFEQVSASLSEALEVNFPAARFPDVTVIIDPGHYHLDSAFTLCANIIARRTAKAQNEESDHMMYYINDGVYGSFTSVLFDSVDFVPVPLTSTESRPKMQSSIWGPTCDSVDCIVQSSSFLLMNVGEWLIFKNMGAHTVATTSTLSGFPKPAIKYILHSHTVAYLSQLPSKPQWMEYIDGEDWCSVEGADESLSAQLNLRLACC